MPYLKFTPKKRPAMFSYSQNDSTASRSRWPTWRTASARRPTSIRARRFCENYRAYDAGFGDLPHTVCYAVKANSSLAVLALLAKAGAGFDIVSGGELFRVLQAGGDPAKVVFSGVGKTAAEVEYALDERHPQLQLRVGSRTGADRCPGRAPRQEGRLLRSASIPTWTPPPIPTFPPDSASTSSASPSPTRRRSTSARGQFRNLRPRA